MARGYGCHYHRGLKKTAGGGTGEAEPPVPYCDGPDACGDHPRADEEGNPNAVPYSAAKSGVIGLTKAIAKEVATKGVIINAITPAVIETEILKQVSQQHIDYMTSRIPMGRVGQPHEVAALAAFLCSDDLTFSTGAIFDLSGGRATY